MQHCANILNENNINPFFSINFKVVLPSFHQDSQIFGETTGFQCTSNNFLAIRFSAIKSILVRKSFDLDYILSHGDNLMKSLKTIQPLAKDGIPLSVKVGGFLAATWLLQSQF